MPIPLLVDLDRTLVRSDLLHELLIEHLKRHPFGLLHVLKWGWKSRQSLKAELSARYGIRPELLPFNQDVLELIQETKRNGGSVLLVTASDIAIAGPVSDYLDIFDEVVTSTDLLNLKGQSKADWAINRFGKGNFNYVGDSLADTPVWKSASRGFVVSTRGKFRVLSHRQKDGTRLELVSERPSELRALLTAMRFKHWSKNLLIFLPLVLAFEFQIEAILSATAAFISFGLVASAFYIFNDLTDITADRQHPEKLERAIASGQLQAAKASIAVLLLSVSGAVLALLTTGLVGLAMLATYALLTMVYSLGLKRIPVLDVLILVSLFLWRIIAGGSASEISVSYWLFIFGFFVFLSLALLKRVAEQEQEDTTQQVTAMSTYRGYDTKDREFIRYSSTAAAFASIAMLSLYLDAGLFPAADVPASGLLMIGVWAFWILRAVRKSLRGEMHHDPIEFALTDRVSFVTILALLVLFVLTSQPIAI